VAGAARELSATGGASSLASWVDALCKLPRNTHDNANAATATNASSKGRRALVGGAAGAESIAVGEIVLPVTGWAASSGGKKLRGRWGGGGSGPSTAGKAGAGIGATAFVWNGWVGVKSIQLVRSASSLGTMSVSPGTGTVSGSDPNSGRGGGNVEGRVVAGRCASSRERATRRVDGTFVASMRSMEHLANNEVAQLTRSESALNSRFVRSVSVHRFTSCGPCARSYRARMPRFSLRPQ